MNLVKATIASSDALSKCDTLDAKLIIDDLHNYRARQWMVERNSE
jgi:hypothetical protein